MKPLHLNTPMLESVEFSRKTGKNILLKMDALQPSGSFKIRGIGRLCQLAVNEGVNHFVSSSGGNAGLAVAYAGRKLAVKVTVVVPESTPERMRVFLVEQGAEVIVTGSVWDESHEHALNLAASDELAKYVHPFDDAIIWQGHSSIIDEIKELNIKPDGIVVSVGGGGLLSGVVEGLKRVGWDDVAVIAAETKGAASYRASLDKNQLVTIDKITSIAKSLGARRVSQQAFDYSRSHDIRSFVCSDAKAVQGCAELLDHQRVLVEPACGASIAAVLAEGEHLRELDTIVVVVCGGSGMTLKDLQSFSESK